MRYALFIVSLSLFFAATAGADPPEAKKCKTHYAATKTDFIEWASGQWSGTVAGVHYLTPTKITVAKGQKIRIAATDRVCWYMRSLCASPKGTRSAWGLYAKIGENGKVFKVGLEYDTVAEQDGEIFFVIPEGKDLWWEPGDCFFYGDNTGRYQVQVFVSRAQPAPPTTIRHSGLKP